MAAKSLDEAVMLAMCVGPVSEFKERLMGELRDYFAHQVMTLEKGATATDLFHKVFKDISAFKKE